MTENIRHFKVTGMSCAACSARIEKAVAALSGVSLVSVNLLTNSMIVEVVKDVALTDEEIIKAVCKAGYGAKRSDKHKSNQAYESGKALSKRPQGSIDENIDNMADNADDSDEIHALRNRFFLSLSFLLPLMYVSMGHMMWDFPMPEVVADNYVALGIFQMLLCIAVMLINKKFFVSGYKGLLNKAPNMDTLVALGATASFVYSVYALFAMTDALIHGTKDLVISYMHEFYFESAATILTLITLGKTLEAYSKGRTTDALKSLMKLSPKTATIVRDGIDRVVDIEEVVPGDIFIVKPGESVPVDGIILEGSLALDESALTGESMHVDKTSGDKVSAATISMSGYAKCEATAVGEDTTLSRIIQMVSDAAASKAPIAKIADRVSGIFVPTVIAIAIITIMVWLLVGKDTGFALARGISVLVISCPCALGLATPVAIMVGNGVGAKQGILFKTAASLEATGKINIIALDKTGTITKGKPQVTDIFTGDNISQTELIKAAYAIEKMSEHPLSVAIVDYYKGIINCTGEESCDIVDAETKEFTNIPGKGLCGLVGETKIYGGNALYIGELLSIPEAMRRKASDFAEEGKTPIYFCKKQADSFIFLGIIAVADVIRDESLEAIKQLKNMGVVPVMLTGDNAKTAKAIAGLAGIENIIAELLPDGKEDVIKKLKLGGNKVAMVGDGINDAPALTRADVGIAIGAGTDIAIDAADVVLMKNSLLDAAAAIRLSRGVIKNIKENLFWAFIYNVLGIPLAAGIWYPLLGLKLNPMFGAAAMSLSSFFVVTNALRLNFLKIKDSSRDKKIIIKEADMNKIKETIANMGKDLIQDTNNNTMEKSVKIEGMMCGHCEARVKKALEELPEVEEAIVSHEKKNAVLKLKAPLSDEAVKKAIEDQGYEVIE